MFDQIFSNIQNVQNDSTIHLLLFLRGNGDMLKNHVLQTLPVDKTTNVGLDTLISAKFDKFILTVDVSSVISLE